jgi:tRNA (guanosine-2'-O-)-methyltransferase
MLTDSRNRKLKNLARRRQKGFSIILENVHDPHNIGAVMRTCDAVGIQDIYVIYTEDSKNAETEYIGINASQGTKKWVNCHFYKSIDQCMQIVKPLFDQILSTHLDAKAQSLYSLDLTRSTALVFGNESTGISKELLEQCTGNFHIPMVGMAQSLNISVAAAISVYEGLRQRSLNGEYDKAFDNNNKYMMNIYEKGIEMTYTKVFETNPKIIKEVVDQFSKK